MITGLAAAVISIGGREHVFKQRQENLIEQVQKAMQNYESSYIPSTTAGHDKSP
jgi:hypothetical protein